MTINLTYNQVRNFSLERQDLKPLGRRQGCLDHALRSEIILGKTSRIVGKDLRRK